MGRVQASSKFMFDGVRNKPAVIGQRILGEGGAARTHHLVADLDTSGVGTDFGDLARPFHPQHGAGAAGAAMRVTLGHAEVGAIEAAGVHADQNLRALRRWLGDFSDCSAVGAIDIGLHAIVPVLKWSRYSAA